MEGREVPSVWAINEWDPNSWSPPGVQQWEPSGTGSWRDLESGASLSWAPEWGGGTGHYQLAV